MTPEGKVKKDIKAWLNARSVEFFMPVQNGYGPRGIGDFVGCWRGRYFEIEAKAEFGDVSAWQERHHHKIRQNGGIVIVAKAPGHIEALEDGFRLLQRVA